MPCTMKCQDITQTPHIDGLAARLTDVEMLRLILDLGILAPEGVQLCGGGVTAVAIT